MRSGLARTQAYPTQLLSPHVPVPLVYVINLNDRKDRLNKMTDLLRANEMSFVRIPGQSSLYLFHNFHHIHLSTICSLILLKVSRAECTVGTTVWRKIGLSQAWLKICFHFTFYISTILSLTVPDASPSSLLDDSLRATFHDPTLVEKAYGKFEFKEHLTPGEPTLPAHGHSPVIPCHSFTSHL